MEKDPFKEYLRESEPDKAHKGYAWSTAIGLQAVDGLKPSKYLIDTAIQNIEGKITMKEAQSLIDSYYEERPVHLSDDERTEEADKVSSRIAEILSETAFSFSPNEYISIHRKLFLGIYKHAGKIRDYNITKKEWVLDGATVMYGSASELRATLEYDFSQEKDFSYKGLSMDEIIHHLAVFVSRLWQNHFWRACWVSWTLGLSEAAGESGNKEFLKKLIYAQVRNVLLNKSFHEVMDVDTGRAWRWPHLPWHAAGFIGFIVNGIFGIRYSEQGIQIHPCILDEFEGAVLDSVPYQNAKFVFEIHGHGDSYTVKMDGKGFTKKVFDGDKVHAGDILVEADLEEIKNAGYQTTTMMILTNTDEFGNVTKAEPAEVKTTSKVMTLTK